MTKIFRKQFYVQWADIDFNQHMANTAYLNLASDTRCIYFAENGFPMSEFERLMFGPIILKDEISYFREFKLLDKIHCELLLAGLNQDVSRFMLRNNFYNDDDQLCAQLTSTGGWLDFKTRKLTVPPSAIIKLQQQLVRDEKFTEII